MEEGKAVGKAEASKQIAQNLIHKDYSNQQISEITGLTMEERNKLGNNL